MQKPDYWKRYLAVRKSGHVIRNHTNSALNRENLATHQWNTTMLLNTVMDESARAVHLMYTLTHDVAEVFTGDIPAPLKWQFVGIRNAVKGAEDWWYEQTGVTDYSKQVHAWEADVTKFCDMVDFMMWCGRERLLGNQVSDAERGWQAAAKAVQSSRQVLPEIKNGKVIDSKIPLKVVTRMHEIFTYLILKSPFKLRPAN